MKEPKLLRFFNSMIKDDDKVVLFFLTVTLPRTLA